MDVGYFTIAVGLVFVGDGAASDDFGGEGAGWKQRYGLTPSTECMKARTRLRPAFLAPN